MAGAESQRNIRAHDVGLRDPPEDNERQGTYESGRHMCWTVLED